MTWITDADLQASEGLARTMTKPLVDLCRGLPTNGALDSPHWSLDKDLPADPATLDESDSGVRFCSPALPLNGEVITWTIAKQREILAHYALEPYLTLNLIDDRSALLITNLVFDKSVTEAQSHADSAVHAVLEAWASEGIFPYRLGLHESQVYSVDPVHSACLNGLKRLFDPHNVFSTGRYQIPAGSQD